MCVIRVSIQLSTPTSLFSATASTTIQRLLTNISSNYIFIRNKLHIVFRKLYLFLPYFFILSDCTYQSSFVESSSFVFEIVSPFGSIHPIFLLLHKRVSTNDPLFCPRAQTTYSNTVIFSHKGAFLTTPSSLTNQPTNQTNK